MIGHVERLRIVVREECMNVEEICLNESEWLQEKILIHSFIKVIRVGNMFETQCLEDVNGHVKNDINNLKILV